MQKFLYRYISFETFVGMIQKKALTFVSPTVWDDPKESTPFYQFVKTIDEESFRIMLMTIYKKTFCQCWSKVKESDALWRIYSYGNRAIQIKASIEKLCLLPDIDIVPVRYSNKIEIDKKEQIDSFLNSMATKRMAFKHEQEVRLIKYYRFEDKEDALKHIKAFLAANDHPQMVDIINSLFPGISADEQIGKLAQLLNIGKHRKETIDVSFDNIPNFIQGVKVHPLAPGWYVEIVEEYCKRNNLPFSGQSKLYSSD